jgi:hypothetical protein
MPPLKPGYQTSRKKRQGDDDDKEEAENDHLKRV